MYWPLYSGSLEKWILKRRLLLKSFGLINLSYSRDKKIAFSNDQKYVVVIGTGDQASLKLNNKLISSSHAQLVYDTKNQLHLQDLNSTNGTFLNGTKILPHKGINGSHPEEGKIIMWDKKSK